MILRLRRWSRSIAVLLVMAATPGVSHLAEDDPACQGAYEAFSPHDHTRHTMRAGEPRHQDHCAICHWTRSLRAPRAAIAIWARSALVARVVSNASVDLHPAPVLELTLARAPPDS